MGQPRRQLNGLKMSEQTVANFKFEFVARLHALLVRKAGLSEDVFPELHEKS